MTDEQGNYSSARLQDALSLKTNIVEAVVASYPADMISKIPVTHFVAYPNEQPDALAASARLVLVGRIVQSEKAVASQAPSIRASQVLALKSVQTFILSRTQAGLALPRDSVECRSAPTDESRYNT